jgi:hypothetical protein
VSVKGIIHPQIVCAPAVRERSQTWTSYEFQLSSLRSFVVQLKPSVLISHPLITAVIQGSKYHFLQDFCIQNKELGEVNIRSHATIIHHNHLSKMRLKAFNWIQWIIAPFIFPTLL